MIQKQTVYLPVKVEDELPNEFDIVTFIAKVPVVNQFQNLTSEEEIDFSFRGWMENDKFLIHGIGEELSDGKVTHWLKPQEAFVFTSEQLNEYTQSIIKQALETAAEKVDFEKENFVDNNNLWDIKDTNVIDKQSITNTFEQTYKKFEV